MPEICPLLPLLWTGQGVTLAAIVLLLLSGVSSYPGIGLFCIGLGNGAVFPNMLQTTPEDFGRENSQAVMGVQMAASYIGTMLLPALFGMIAQYINAALFPFYLLILYGIMIAQAFGPLYAGTNGKSGIGSKKKPGVGGRRIEVL